LHQDGMAHLVSRVPAPLRILASGALFSLGGTLIKVCQFPGLQSAGLRAIIAALTLFLLLPEARRLPSFRILLLLPAYFGATCLFVVANTFTTAANAIFLQAAYPLWVTVFGPLLLRERPRRIDLIVLAIILLGMLLFFLSPTARSATAPDPRLGDVLAIVSGVCYGLLLVGFRWLGRAGAGEQCAAVAWGNVFTAPVALALAPVFGQQLVAGDANSWLAIAVLGVFQVGCAYALLVRAISHVPAVQASVLLMIEPAMSPVIAFLAHGERPHGLAIAGGVVIVAAVLIGGLSSTRR
jgi:drug/metabolite transporter (DMT)-like permease